MFRGHHLSLCVLGLLVCSSCCTTANPKYPESTPPNSCSSWKPPCTPKIDVLPSCDITQENLSALELIDIALRNNPETRATWNRARAAAYQLQATKSTLYPIVGAEAGYAATYQDFGGSGKDLNSGVVVITDPTLEDENGFLDPSTGIAIGDFIGGSSNFSHLIVSDLSASYLLFDFGARCATIESARQALQAANWQHNRNLQSVMIHVLNAYYAYLDVKALLEAQQDDLEDAELNLEAAQELYNAGVKTQLDVLQSKSQLVNIQLIIEETKGFVQIELGNLANALGLPANTELSVAALPSDLPKEEKIDNVEELMEVAKQRRPDLAAYQADYKKKQAELKFANADGLPYVTANGEVQRVDGLTRSLSSGFVYSGTLSVEVPLFRGYYYTNQQRAAKARVSQACANLQSKESDVLLEVWKSYYAFNTAVQTYKYSEEFLKYTEMTYDAAMGGYKEGTGSILDLLSAQKALSRARAQKIQARTLWVTSLARIAYATGTL